MKEFYSVKEFCELLGIGRTTLYRWIKAGKIEVLKENPQGKGRVIIPAAAVEELKCRAVPEVQNNGE